MKRWWASIVLLASTSSCAVNVASVQLAAPHPLSMEEAGTAVSRGWHEGESCRFWLLGIPFGLPKVDEAIDAAMKPVQGAFMRDITVVSAHPVYVLYGWHCYRIRGEVFGIAE